VAEQLGSYVYLLIDPHTERVFYVGKGVGERCFAHIVEARRRPTTARSGDYVKLDIIREIESEGHPVGIEILRHGLDENAAFMLESATIDLLGFGDLANKVVGQHAVALGRAGVDEVNARLGAHPVTFLSEDRVVLIRVAREFHRGIDQPALYEATRRWWRVDARRRELGGARAPEFALSVYRGVVRAAYRIEGWEPAPAEEMKADTRVVGRWGFWGTPAADVLERYGFGDVTSLLPQAAQNPSRYVNCGS
jgi:hypothetical protein